MASSPVLVLTGLLFMLAACDASEAEVAAPGGDGGAAGGSGPGGSGGGGSAGSGGVAAGGAGGLGGVGGIGGAGGEAGTGGADGCVPGAAGSPGEVVPVVPLPVNCPSSPAFLAGFVTERVTPDGGPAQFTSYTITEHGPVDPLLVPYFASGATHRLVAEAYDERRVLWYRAPAEELRPPVEVGERVEWDEPSAGSPSESTSSAVALRDLDGLMWAAHEGFYSEFRAGAPDLLLERDRKVCGSDTECGQWPRAARVVLGDRPAEVVVPGSIVALGGDSGGLFALSSLTDDDPELCPPTWLPLEASFFYRRLGRGAVDASCEAGCEAGHRCDDPSLSCGAGPASVCRAPPVSCAEGGDAVCGCDGRTHGNLCALQAAGVAPAEASACPAPDGYFACGPRFCRIGAELCVRHEVGVPGHAAEASCAQLPSSCALGAPTCGCAADQECGASCLPGAPGEVTLTCRPPWLAAEGVDVACDDWSCRADGPVEDDGARRLDTFAFEREAGISEVALLGDLLAIGSRGVDLRRLSTREERRVRVVEPRGLPFYVGFAAGHLVTRGLRCADDACWDIVTFEALDGCEYWELPPASTEGGLFYDNLVADGQSVAWIELDAMGAGPVRLFDVPTRTLLPLEPPIVTGGSVRFQLRGRFLLYDRREGATYTNVFRDLLTGEEQSFTQLAQDIVLGDGIAVGFGRSGMIVRDLTTGEERELRAPTTEWIGVHALEHGKLLYQWTDGVEATRLLLRDLSSGAEVVVASGRDFSGGWLAADRVIFEQFGEGHRRELWEAPLPVWP